MLAHDDTISLSETHLAADIIVKYMYTSIANVGIVLLKLLNVGCSIIYSTYYYRGTGSRTYIHLHT